MFTRETIVETLAKQREAFVARYRSFTPEELTQLCTQSEASDGTPWQAKDHIAHLTMIERAFQRMVERTIAGSEDPVGFGRFGGFEGGNREEIVAWVHRNNQVYVDAHRDDDLETLLTRFTATRAGTLALLEHLTDEQLAAPLPGAPWADGSIGGVLITNAHHEMMHLNWVEEGLTKGLSH